MNAREAVEGALEAALTFDDVESLPVRWHLSIEAFWMALYEGGFVVVRAAHSDGNVSAE